MLRNDVMTWSTSCAHRSVARARVDAWMKISCYTRLFECVLECDACAYTAAFATNWRAIAAGADGNGN